MKKLLFNQDTGEVIGAVRASSDEFASRIIQNTPSIDVPLQQSVDGISVDTKTQVVEGKKHTQRGVARNTITVPDVKRIQYSEIDAIINSITNLGDVKVVLRRILEHVSDKPDVGGGFRHKQFFHK